MTPCGAGEFCKQPFLPLVAVKPCVRCTRSLHVNCAWSSSSLSNTSGGVSLEEPICPLCFQQQQQQQPQQVQQQGQAFSIQPQPQLQHNPNTASGAPPFPQPNSNFAGIAFAGQPPATATDTNNINNNNHQPKSILLSSNNKSTAHTAAMMSMTSKPQPKFGDGGSNKRKKDDQQQQQHENEFGSYPPQPHEEDDSMNGVGVMGGGEGVLDTADEDQDHEGMDTSSSGQRGTTASKLGGNKKKKYKLGNGDTTKESALSLHAIRNTLQTPREEYRPATSSFLVNGVDITQKHVTWQHETRILTPHNRNSAWWIAYHQGTVLEDDTFKAIGVCNVCGNILQLGARSGTSSLTRHLASRHPSVHRAILAALREGLMLSKYYDQTDGSGSGTLRPSVARFVDTSKKAPATTARIQKEFAASAIAAKCLDAHVVYAADRNRSFEEFDEPSFFELRRTIAETALACARGRVGQGGTMDLYQLDSNAIRDRAHAMSEEIKTKVSQMIHKNNAPIVAALHSWKGREGYQYHAFIIHWIQNFSRMSCCISVDMDKGSSLSDWKSLLRLFGMTEEPRYIVTDSALVEGGNHIVECLDQKLQKVADVAFRALLEPPDETSEKPVGAEALNMARCISGYFVENSEAKEALAEKQKMLKPELRSDGLIQDLGCQWWSSFAMINRLLEHREAVTSCCSELPGLPFRTMSEAEWNTLLCLRTVLSPMMETINNLKEEKANVSSPLVAVIFYEIRERLQSLSQREALDVLSTPLEFIKSMVEKFDEVTGNFLVDPFASKALDPAFIFAHALSPSFKKLKLFKSDTREIIWNRLLAEMIDLQPATDEIDIKKDPSEPKGNTQKEEEPRSSFGAFAAIDSSDDEEAAEGNRGQSTWKAACEIELSGFKLEKGTKFGASEDPDTLKWWSERVWRFPTLWKLCQVYFCLPATAAPADKAFDPNGNLTTHKRCALASNAMENSLHCVHENKWVLAAPDEPDGMMEVAPLKPASVPVKQEEKESSV